MNPVLMLTHNALVMTQRAAFSALTQSVETKLYVIDNGSSDGTVEWLDHKHLLLDASDQNAGVSLGWNVGLARMFLRGEKHCLVINNDVILPPWFYEELLSYDAPFVTGISVDNMDAIKEPNPRVPLVGHPDFSAFLIHSDAWWKIGLFDENMKFYAQDCDYHVRAHRLGVPLMCANVPFYHERSSTLRLAPEYERQQIEMQANRDRQVFREKYGCIPGEPAYEGLFQ